ncbi:MAG: B12-binding domain-containing radical SAM protein [Endomicrobiales bacterium]
MDKKGKLKVLLAQLPRPCLGLSRDHDAVPLASGYLKAMAHKEGLLERADIEILSARETKVLPDSGLIEAIVARGPDILGFSLNFRSSMRSLYIASEVKKRLPGMKVIVGGPDVTLDSGHVTGNAAVDIGVIGEGEVTFCEIVRHVLEGNGDYSDIKGIFYRKAGAVVVNEEREKIQDLNGIPSPYLLGYIDPAEYAMIWLENTRGCRHRCSYCQGADTYSGHFPAERIGRELEYIAARGKREVGFCDSSFVSSPNFEELCGRLKQVRKRYGVAFFACAFAEDITEEKAELLRECGFYAVEIGLQSANRSTLKAVGRNIDRERFVNGIKLLERKGIPYLVDVIAGLPGDTLEDYKETLRFVTGNNPGRGSLHALQLRLLPGTRLRKEAVKHGIRYREEPPYEIVGAPYISRNEITEAMLLSGNKRGLEFSASFACYCRSGGPAGKKKEQEQAGQEARFNKVIVHLDPGSQDHDALRRAGEKLSGRVRQPFTVHFISRNAGEDTGLMVSFIEPIASVNPYLVWNVIVESGAVFTRAAAGRIRRRIRTREKIDMDPAISLCGVFPWNRDLSKALEKRGGGFPYYWAVNIDREGMWRETGREALSDGRGCGIVVDADPALRQLSVLKAALYLFEEGRKRGKEVHCRNLALAYAVPGAGQAEALRRRCVIEPVVELDNRMTMRQMITRDAETALGLIGWQIRIGKSRGDIIIPAGYDRM